MTTPQVRAELVAHAPEGIGAGRTVWLGLLIQHQPEWHTYWRNPGDSGLPIRLEWRLPAGVQAGEIQWPTPKRLPIGPLLNYGFEGTTLLPVPLRIDSAFSGSTLEVKLRGDWLVCRIECIPESGEFTLNVPTQSPTLSHATQFAQSFAAQPSTVPGATAKAKVEDDALVLRVSGLPKSLQGKTLTAFPETAGVIEHAAPMRQQWQRGEWEGRMPLSPQRSASPSLVPAVLVAGQQSVRVEAQMTGPWPTLAEAAPTFDASTTVPEQAPLSTPTTTFGLALLFAFIGGALLNLMPCVFPVLSLKLLGFARHADERRYLALGGAAYTLGVLLSFIALAALLLALRAAGEQLGWGFQLQEPGFVAALAVLFTLIGLNLAGVFELRTLVPSNAAGWQSRHPVVDSFLTGVLAVAIASPCTAPFMGAALGFAISLPATQALTIFAVLGLGMAAPYLLVSLVPALARALPRPGPWLLRFKILMAFPMFATVIWLLWVLGQQVGIDGVAALLLLLLTVALALWIWASPLVAGRTRLWLGALSLLLLAVVLGWSLPLLKPAPSGSAQAAVAGGWEAWSAQRVADYQAQGRPVFVDFTAAWCVTCQYNKRTTLADAAVLNAFKEKKVALLRADWTSRDPAITTALTQLGRSGVPVYALYPGSPGAAPSLLSELPSVKEVTAAVAPL